MRKTSWTLLIVVLAATGAGADHPTPLFNGRDLTGWQHKEISVRPLAR